MLCNLCQKIERVKHLEAPRYSSQKRHVTGMGEWMAIRVRGANRDVKPDVFEGERRHKVKRYEEPVLLSIDNILCYGKMQKADSGL
jgi:hypothetical protein